MLKGKTVVLGVTGSIAGVQNRKSCKNACKTAL